MTLGGPILDIPAFYAHALAIENEAVRRYREFEAYFDARGDEVLASLCRNLAQQEEEHLGQLIEESGEMKLPPVGALAHGWLSRAAGAAEDFYRIVSPRQLLNIALASECEALGFFEWVARTTPDPGVKGLAEEMARDEMQHVRWVRDALEYHGDAVV